MPGSFFGINIASRALTASQGALDVVGQNTANASTAGYSRQIATLATTAPYTVPSMNKTGTPGQLGTGVEIQSVTRARNTFLDNQYRRENQSLGYWQTLQDNLSKIEGVFNEPSDSGFQTVLDNFWSALQELSKNPQSDSVRATVVQNSVALTDSFNQAYKALVQQQSDINSVIQTDCGQVNTLVKQIKDLNDQIVKIEAGGVDHANDLRDRRDLLVDQLSNLISIQVNEDQTGAINISTAGQTLLQGSAVEELTTKPVSGPNGQEIDMPYWQDTGQQAVMTNGVIKGLIDARDGSVQRGNAQNGIQGYIDQLNTLAQALVQSVNQQHTQGYDYNGAAGLDFFDSTVPANGNWAQTMAVSPNILNDPRKIAAAGEDSTNPGNSAGVGNGDNAIALAQLSTTPNNTVLNGATSEDYYKAMIAQLGVDGQSSQRFTTNQGLLVSSIDNQRQSVSGVSLDEEMTNMIKFQKVYNAAARMMTTNDEMLDQVISHMGHAGSV